MTRIEDLNDAQIKFIKLNWRNTCLSKKHICEGIITAKGQIVPAHLDRIALKLVLGPRPPINYKAVFERNELGNRK